jgi:hypothetical protein
MIVVITLLFELICLPFRIVGWVLCKIAGPAPDDMGALRSAVDTLEKDPTVTNPGIRRKKSV